jgi:hypothetical protein
MRVAAGERKDALPTQGIQAVAGARRIPPPGSDRGSEGGADRHLSRGHGGSEDVAGLLVEARFNVVRVIPGPPGGALQMVAARRPS